MAESLAFDTLLQNWRGREFHPFRDGVEISILREGAPGVALLRYAPGAGVPRHRHPALETILVLEGVQSDERGDYPAGSLILNAEGTEHSVWSETGCTVLIQWNLPVEFVG
jgi:anti-sigma factor ChrR (cupin superfamily)